MRIHQLPFIAMLLCIPGCHVLGIPSERFEEGVITPGCAAPCCGPSITTETPLCLHHSKLHNYVRKCFNAKNRPPAPRFHPIPTHPAFAPTGSAEEESAITYGRFGKAEATPMQPNSLPVGMKPATSADPNDFH